MESLLSIIGPVFWGLLLLSVLVFVHEGGHFLAARACGVRVLEFFLGMPCRFNISHVSKRIGTKFGITPLLIGGYAEICGMDPTKVACAPQVLGCIHRHGVVTLSALAEELGISEEDAKEACTSLYGWGSIVPWDGVAEEREDGFPSAFAAASRDASGNTVYDGRSFDSRNATAQGEAWDPVMGDEAFYASERSRTYSGVGFWKRAFMLVAGIAVNIITGFILVIGVYSILGVGVPVDMNEVGSVGPNSPAERAGITEGDLILSVNGEDVSSWTGFIEAVDKTGRDGEVELSVWKPHAGVDKDKLDKALSSGDALDWLSANGDALVVSVAFDSEGMLGIGAPQRTVRLDPISSCSIAIDNIVSTARSVGSLLNPRHTMEVLDNSTSIVGISVMSAQAASAGPATFLNFAALISFSLGFMNLLPIPPLDGGKLLIEVVQAITRREVPLKVQTAISIVGIALFGLLFVYMLRSDILRFF